MLKFLPTLFGCIVSILLITFLSSLGYSLPIIILVLGSSTLCLLLASSYERKEKELKERLQQLAENNASDETVRQLLKLGGRIHLFEDELDCNNDDPIVNQINKNKNFK